MNLRKIRNYDQKFKLNAVELYLESGRSYSKIAAVLGIPKSSLVGWVLAYREDKAEAFLGRDHVE